MDEAGFKCESMPIYGWSKSSEKAIHREKAISSENSLRAVCYYGVVQLNLKRPFRNITKKAKSNLKRKLENRETYDSKSTSTAHFKLFILDVFDVLGQYPDFRNCYLIIRNASIHKNPSIARIVRSKGYRVQY